MKLNSSKNLRFTVLAVATALALSACGGKGDDAAAKQKQAAAAHQVPVVGVVTVQPTEVTVSNELPARLESRRSADVRAQVSGIIKKRLFQEGSYVRAGQALYQLDDASYVASLESARAQLASAEATLAKAVADETRYRPLVEADAVSKQEYDATVQAKRSGQASVESARAAIKAAKVNVDHARITAPISGFIGQSKVSEGALVSASDTTALANIQQTNPMYINVTESATNVMALRQQIADGTLSAVNSAIEVTVKLDNGQEYPYKARLLFADPTVDQATGQITLRAEVPNPDNILMPGLYVRVSLPSATIQNAFVVPQQAVTRGQKDSVMIVNAQGGMEPREVTVTRQQGTNWVITAGLKAGDKVIVDGTSIAGMTGAKKVTPKEWTLKPDNQAAGAQAKPQAASAAKSASVKTASAAR